MTIGALILAIIAIIGLAAAGILLTLCHRAPDEREYAARLHAGDLLHPRHTCAA